MTRRLSNGVDPKRVKDLRETACVVTDAFAESVMPNIASVVESVAEIAMESDPWSALESRRMLAEKLDRASRSFDLARDALLSTFFTASQSRSIATIGGTL